MSAWEYKTVEREQEELLTEEQLNKLGASGYELISVLALTDEIIVVGRQQTHRSVHYFFKRPKAAKRRP